MQHTHNPQSTMHTHSGGRPSCSAEGRRAKAIKADRGIPGHVKGDDERRATRRRGRWATRMSEQVKPPKGHGCVDSLPKDVSRASLAVSSSL